MRPGTLPVAASLAGAFVAGAASVLVGDMRCSFSATTIETVATIIIATNVEIITKRIIFFLSRRITGCSFL
jgi:hypothetical protein